MAARKKSEPLFDAVYSAPADVGPRLVLADALLEAGDPRGELIVESHRRLQKGSATPSKKERALLAEHGARWLGPLATVIKQPTWHLGFVSGGVLAGGRELGEQGVNPVAGCREWATVTRLRFWPEQHEINEQVLGFEHLTSLESVGSVLADSIETVARKHGPRAWRELTNIPDFGVDGPSGGWAKLGTLARQLPKLEAVTLSGSSMMDFYFEDLKPFLDSPLFGSLKRLELQLVDVERLIEFVSKTKLEHLRCRAPNGVYEFDGVTKKLTAP